MKKTFILALVLVVVAAGMAVAQTLTGTISGKVVDQQGAVLPGVTVTLTGTTGLKTTVSDSKGEFRFVGLTPGKFSIKSELQGFRSASQQNLDVTMGKTVDVSLSMTVGGMTEVVEVVANAVSIDPTTTATDTSMAQSLLFSMPITHNNPAVNLLNYSPGVNDGSAFGGSSSSGNSLMLDGVDTRDPEAGTAWAFYNYNIIDEVQVGSLGQPAEYGGFTGAIINTITKSGGNRFSFLGEYRYSSEGLGSNNVPATYHGVPMVDVNKNLLNPAKVLSLKDYTVQLGGPLKKDKLFFFLSAQRYEISQIISGPIRGEVSPRFNAKISWQPTSSDTVTGSLQYDNYNQTGRTAFIPGYAVTSNSQTIDQDSPEYIWNGQWRKVFGSTTFFEAKFLGYWGYYDLNPVSPDKPAHIDDSGAYSGGAGGWYQADRTRNQLNMSLSKYAGAHSFKFGAEIERSNVRNRFAYVGLLGTGISGTPGGYFYDYGGQPYLAYGYSYDIQGKSKRETFYAQDQWKVGGGFTLNFGLRGDRIRGESTTLKKELYNTMSWGPRVGAAIDLTGKGTSVVRAFYGQMYDGAIFASWGRAVPGLTDFITYEVGPNWKSVTEVDRVPAALKYTVADNLKHPRVDETNISWEQQIGRTYKFTATGIYRDWKNFINSMLIGGIWSPVAYTSTFNNMQMTLYKWANKTGTGSVPQQFLIQNTDNVDYTLANGQKLAAVGYRTYKGAMFQFQRALRNRWQAQISYVLSSTKGTITNSSTAGISSGQFETPNTIAVNSDGPTPYDRRHEVKAFVGYQIPRIEVSVNAYWRYLSGWPYTPYGRVSSSVTAWSGTLNVNLQPKGAYYKTDNETNLDLRLEKVFDVGFHRLGVYMDIQNMLNQGYLISPQTRYPNISLTDRAGKSFTVKFGDPITLNAARQITFGGRWSF